MKKFLAALLSLTLAMSLFACGSEAPAEDAKPSEEAVPACEHMWKEATFEAPKTCEKCGATEGEKLTPYLETLNLEYVSPNEEVEYTSVCQEAPDRKTTGRVSFTNMQTIEGNETYEAKEGYEWHIADITFFFFGDAFNYGCTYCGGWANYYGQEYTDETKEKAAVRINGELFPVEERYDHLDGPFSEGELTKTLRVAVQVPVGFDGIVWDAISLDVPGIIPDYEEFITAETTVFCKDK